MRLSTWAWNNRVQAGVAYTGLSALTMRMAVESQISTAGLSSLQLLAAIRDDLGDPLPSSMVRPSKGG